MENTHPSTMTLDQLTAVGLKHQDDFVASGVPSEGREYLLTKWISDLVEYQGVHENVAKALRARLLL